MEYVVGQDLRQIVRAIQAKGEWLTPEHICRSSSAPPPACTTRTTRRTATATARHRPPRRLAVEHPGQLRRQRQARRLRHRPRQLVAGHTGLGALKGKVPYMSPEQCRGEALDRRSDVFSLGIILWELSLRRRLFSGDNDLVVAARSATRTRRRRRRSTPTTRRARGDRAQGARA
jgi:serine/threonine protein kinase